MAATTPPLSLGEILDRTVQLYRRNLWLFVGISFLPAAVDVLITGSASVFFSSQLPQVQASSNPQGFLAFFGYIAAFLLIGVPLLLGVYSFALNALNYTAFERSHGVAVTLRGAYAYAFRHLWRYLGIFSMQMVFAVIVPCAVFAGISFIGAMLSALLATGGVGPAIGILIGIAAFVLVIALAVVVVSIWLRFCLAFPACAAEQTKAWPAMQRSNRLTKGSRGRIFVMYLLVFCLTLVAFYALDLPVQIILKLTIYKSTELLAIFTKPPLLLTIVNLFISFLERSFVMPVYAIALVLFYNDQRTRHEGYDIELLMAQAGLFNVAAAEVSGAEPAPASFPGPEAQTESPFATEADGNQAPAAEIPEVLAAPRSDSAEEPHPPGLPPAEVPGA